MSKLYINQVGIAASKTKLISLNNDIYRDFFDLRKNIIVPMFNNWDSPASQLAMQSMGNIHNTYSQARFDAFSDMANFLEQYINPGYDATEASNVTLAEMFK